MERRSRVAVSELQSERADQYRDLCVKYRQDDVYRAVVDMYRNMHREPEVAAHWMGLHDVTTYVHDDGTFRPMIAGYDPRELSFLVEKGLKLGA